jgi:hypothetical protein
MNRTQPITVDIKQMQLVCATLCQMRIIAWSEIKLYCYLYLKCNCAIFVKLFISQILHKSVSNVTYPLWHKHTKDIIYPKIGLYAVISIIWKQRAEFYISMCHGVSIAFHIAKVMWQTQLHGNWKVELNPVYYSKVIFSTCVTLYSYKRYFEYLRWFGQKHIFNLNKYVKRSLLSCNKSGNSTKLQWVPLIL